MIHEQSQLKLSMRQSGHRAGTILLHNHLLTRRKPLSWRGTRLMEYAGLDYSVLHQLLLCPGPNSQHN